MLNKHQDVVIKPIIGSFGKNVIRISLIKSGVYKVHEDANSKIIKGRKKLELFLKEKTGKTPFLVQYCIQLATVNDMSLDFRYIVQRRGTETDWEITGKHGKVAKSGFFITNLNKGASVVAVEEALKLCHNDNVDINQVMNKLEWLSLNCAKCLTSYFPRHTIWGLDLAVDRNGKVWIIEVNANPKVEGFSFLNDLSMYQTIKKYQAYNKNYR